MNPEKNLPTGRPWRSLLIATSVFLAVGLSAGGAVWWWQNRDVEPVVLTTEERTDIEQRIEKPRYEAGAKSFVLSEREFNGLFNHHTQLGEQVRFELDRNAIHARVRTTLDEGVPLLGGKTIKAKARFLVSADASAPSLVLDDFTVYGISLPNAWLGDLKGQNLLASLTGDLGGNALAKGIEDISIEPGQLRISLAK